MLKGIFFVIRKIILAVLLIYAYNKMTFPMNLFIPMNLVTISLVTIFGIPSIFMFILFSLFIV